MTRSLAIFNLYLQGVFEKRAKSFVYFLQVIAAPLLAMTFWIAAAKSNTGSTPGFSLNQLSVYFLFLTIGNALLVSHIEDNVGEEDIYEGQLSQYLLKPYPYIVFKFFYEFPHRILEGMFAFILFFSILALNPHLITTSISFESGLLITCMLVCSLVVGFLFKMILGLTAFWVHDTHGVNNVCDIIILLFGGFVMPLSFFPNWLSVITNATPFPYMLYYPTIALQGKLGSLAEYHVVEIQLVWIAILSGIYSIMWKKGIRKFTSFGQ